MIVESGTVEAGGLAVGLSGTLVMLGAFLKNKTPINPDWIPMILLIVAIPTYIGLTWPVDFNGAVMAVGSALSAVGMYEATRGTKAATKQGTIRETPKE